MPGFYIERGEGNAEKTGRGPASIPAVQGLYHIIRCIVMSISHYIHMTESTPVSVGTVVHGNGNERNIFSCIRYA